MGQQGTGGAHLAVAVPAALLNKESFSLLFLFHPDTFLLMLFLLFTCCNYSWSSSIEFWASLAYCPTEKKTPKKQEKHCRLEKQLSRGCARQRHLAQVLGMSRIFQLK